MTAHKYFNEALPLKGIAYYELQRENFSRTYQLVFVEYKLKRTLIVKGTIFDRNYRMGTKETIYHFREGIADFTSFLNDQVLEFTLESTKYGYRSYPEVDYSWVLRRII